MENRILEDILGQSQIFEEITKVDATDATYLISAPAGGGKHYLIDKLSAYYQNKHDICLLHLTSGHPGMERGQEFAPFLTMLSANEDVRLTNITNVGKSFVEVIPYVGKVVSQALTQRKVYPAVFETVEIEILVRLERILGHKEVIFLCEKLDEWDMPSLRFLSKLFSHHSSTQKMKFICTSSSQPLSIPGLDFAHVATLCAISREDAKRVVDILSPNNSLDRETIEKLYTLSGGNIGILAELNKLIEENGSYLLNESSAYRNITLKKLRGVLTDTPYQTVTGLLDRASLIGERAYKKLLQVFTKYEAVEFGESIRISAENNILTDDIEDVFFNSSSVWHAFYVENVGNKQFHHELANGIKSLTPSGFARISEELLYAGEEQEAAIYCILALLHEYHTYRIMPAVPPNEMHLIKRNRLDNVYQSLIGLYSDYFAGKLDSVLQSAYRYKESRLMFEVDYMKALAHINGSVKQSSYRQALMILESWIEDENFRAESPFQWLRAAHLALGAQYEVDETPMHMLEKQIEKTRRSYIGSDEGIERLEYDFLSKCNYCYQIDTAYLYTKQAAEYFRKHLNHYPSSYPYLIALVNSAANSLVMGKYQEAIDYSMTALSVAEERYPSFGSTDALINNLLIAGLLNGNLETPGQIDAAIIQLDRILSSTSEDIISNILIRNNRIVATCYKGDILSAAGEMHKLYSDLQYIEDIDDYYLYLIGSNDCVLDYMSSGKEPVQKRFESLCELRPLPHDHSYFSARNRCIAEKISKGIPVNITECNWNELGEPRVGPAWSFWGKWLLFSDMQIWSD